MISINGEYEILRALANSDIVDVSELPKSPHIAPNLRFGSFFISLERLKLESSNFVPESVYDLYFQHSHQNWPTSQSNKQSCILYTVKVLISRTRYKINVFFSTDQ